MILSLELGETVPNMKLRDLNKWQIQFTSGVSFIRECRVMRNSSKYVNPKTTCQPVYESGNWNVYLYDVANSDLSSGWWVQLVANYTSATLAYTSYVRCKANNVV